MPQVTYGSHSYGEIEVIGGRDTSKLIVGKYCSISAEVKAFMSGDHNMGVISTFPFYHNRRGITNTTINPRLLETQSDTIRHRQSIEIGNDVWIGHGAVLFRGVTIGDGACIGAFSVITKDIPAYSVAVGHSRIVRKRFSQEDIDFLLELKWWDFPDSVVATLAPILHTPNVDLLRQWARDHEQP